MIQFIAMGQKMQPFVKIMVTKGCANHGYLEVNGVCLLGHNEYFSALLLSMVNTNFFFKSIKPIKIIIVTN